MVLSLQRVETFRMSFYADLRDRSSRYRSKHVLLDHIATAAAQHKALAGTRYTDLLPFAPPRVFPFHLQLFIAVLLLRLFLE